VFLGCSTTHKGYKCLSPRAKLFISKDVFNECRFPYKDLFPSLSLEIFVPDILALSLLSNLLLMSFYPT